MANFKSTLEIGGFDCAADAVKFLRNAGPAYQLRAPRPDPTRVVGCAILANGRKIGAVVMLRKGVTLRIDTRLPGAIHHVGALVSLANEWEGR